MIVDLSRVAVARETTVDVCIIGSGCGGATAAWELARAGREVLVLEEGGDYTGGSLSMRDDMYDQLYMERGGRATSDLAITVLQGRALGGGGVINASDVVPIPSGVLGHWRSRHGLSDLSPETIAPFAKLALDDLSANHPRDDQINANNALLRDGARALGLRGEVMMHNRRGCVGFGKCLVGCAKDAKKNPRFVAIPGALAAGARFFLRARAVRVEGETDELKRVHVRVLDEKGYHERAAIVVRARTVILAANAVASAQLLLRSAIGNEHVGRNLSLQPQLPITAMFDREVQLFRGIPQSYAVTEYERVDEERGLSGFRIEGIGGTPGIMASLLPTYGHEGKALMKKLPQIAASLLLVPDAGNGRVLVERSGRPRIEYAIPDEQKQRYRDAIRAAARIYFAAGAREVLVPLARPIVLRSEAELTQLDSVSFEPATAPFLSAHQQGTVRMSTSEKTGACDPDGRVYGTRGVFVFDSSPFPTTASSHTMAPILTMSRYLARRLLASN